MSLLFLDTSALAKRYVTEAGSAWVNGVLEPASGNVTAIADVTIVEMFSLLAPRVREGFLPSTDATRLGNTFLVHAENAYVTAPLDDPTIARARSLVGRYPLRALDAIQLASAQIDRPIDTWRVGHLCQQRPHSPDRGQRRRLRDR